MHNEGPSDTPWLAEEDKDYDPSQNRRLDMLLFNLASDLDPTRHIHKNSGYGDNHIFIGWKSGQWTNFGDWSMLGGSGQSQVSESSSPTLKIPGAPFVTEYGAQALPNIEMMSTIFSPEELLYASGEIRERWEFHNFQQTETFNIARVDSGDSVQEFIQNSQAYQANLIKFATENYRRAKYNPMQGIFYSMFADPWPSITSAVLDYDRQPKSGYNALQNAMQPVLPSIFPSKPAGLEGISWVYEDPADFSASLWVINDTQNTYPGAMLRWRIDTDSDQRVTFGEIQVDVAPDSSRQFWTVSSDRLKEGAYKITVVLSNQDGQVLGENDFAFKILPHLEENTE
jgi:beta-mannosidase